MDIQSAGVKFFVAQPAAVNLEPFLAIFHGWIQEQAGDELLIDVADYRHVQAGPGVVLVGHEANYSMDNAGGRLGMLYQRKASMNGDVPQRLERVVRAALLACRRIEAEPSLRGGVKFDGQAMQLVINDRMLAPNTQETFAALEPELDRLAKTLFAGARVMLVRDSLDARERFTVLARADRAFTVDTLLGNLA